MDRISRTFADLTVVGVSLLLVVGLTACEKPGPAESAGKKMDETIGKAGKKQVKWLAMSAKNFQSKARKRA